MLWSSCLDACAQSCAHEEQPGTPVLRSVASLPTTQYWKVGAYFGVILVLYLLWALPVSYIKHNQTDAASADDLR